MKFENMIDKILLGDCLESMKNIPDNSIDLIVTDPPYRIIGGGCSTGVYGNGKKSNPGGIFNKLPSGILNRQPPKPREYVKGEDGRTYLKGTKHVSLGGVFNDAVQYARQGKLFKYNDIKFSEWLPELYRILKPTSHIYIYISPRNLKDLQQQAEKVGFKFQQLIVWKKNNATPNKYYLNSYELILMLRKGSAKNINNMGTKNVLEVQNITRNKKHPTEKPIELMEILINNSSNEGDIVLDPFCGVGSTCIACKKNNRKYIGIEIDEEYYKIAEERLSKT